MRPDFFIYLAVMAGVTYLVRAVPLILVKKPIKNRFLLSFLHYIPYAVLAAMTVPAIFYATDYFISAVVGCAVAAVLSFFKKGLIVVAVCSCVAVLMTELCIIYVF